MDKYEYKLKLDQMKTLAGEKHYSNAAEVADSINWRKVKNVNSLVKAGDIYAKTGRYDEARDVLLMAYDRSPIGRMIIYRLAELSIKMRNFEEAEEYYEEFIEIAPHDNLKYVLRFKISKAKGLDYATLIAILEELKQVEYTEEWAYELAYLYHQLGESDKCIEACDELILWFGDGVYVERSLELKMLYQPLTKSQEDKYRNLKQHKDGIKELYPHEETEKTSIEIPAVMENSDKFNTINLQEELAKSMKQIMEATEQETVSHTMVNIKKLVEEIPYLQMPHENMQEGDVAPVHIKTNEEIDGSLRMNFNEMLTEDLDHQVQIEPEIVAEAQEYGKMSIEDVLGEWEKTKRAAETALQRANEQKLESVKAKALQEAGDIMERLSDVIPKLDAGFTSEDLLREEYLQQDDISNEERAGRIMEGMNNMLQQQIDRLQEEAEEENTRNAMAAAAAAKVEEEAALSNEHELLRKIKLAKPNFDEQIGLRPYVPNRFDSEEEAEDELPQIQMEIPEAENMGLSDDQMDMQETEEDGLPHIQMEIPEFIKSNTARLPEITLPEDIEKELSRQDTKQIKSDEVSRALQAQMQRMEEEGEDIEVGERPVITKLNEDQKALFSYFVPVDGMERQICQVLTGASARLAGSPNSSTGNILIQGGRGCGKTVLATSIIKALQREVKRPNGKIGKISAEALNKKDIAALLKKVAGGCLIIEQAGGISRETAVKMSLLLESDTSGLLVIMEDTRVGLEQAMSQDDGFSKKFTEKIMIPVFTSDELVAFGKAYANDLDYEIDEMGVLALYNRISTIQRLDRATTLTEVKELVDQAIVKAERQTLKKAFSILTSRRYNEEDYVILREKDFEE